jgi:hypothetical protein
MARGAARAQDQASTGGTWRPPGPGLIPAFKLTQEETTTPHFFRRRNRARSHPFRLAGPLAVELVTAGWAAPWRVSM